MRRTANRLFGDQYRWSILAAGRHQMPLCTYGAIMGANVRVGLEDSIYLGKGELAPSTAAQVAKLRRILEDLSLEIDAVQGLGVKALAIAIDITDPTDIEFGVEAAARHFGGLDILVNNAATTRRPEGDDGSLSAITPDYWDAMTTANVRGPFLMARAVERYLRASSRGRIVNIGSTIGQGSHGAALPFSVTKASIAPLTRFLAVRLAPDILENCVAPGLMLGTGLTQNATEEFADTWLAAASTGKTTSIDDVARQVVGCCATTTMTGQVITIDGGIHLPP